MVRFKNLIIFLRSYFYTRELQIIFYWIFNGCHPKIDDANKAKIGRYFSPVLQKWQNYLGFSPEMT